jgi:hypothetical protein
MTAEEEDAVTMFPLGYRFTLLWVSYIKHALVNLKMTAGYRLRFLEYIDDAVCLSVSREMVELVQPMSETEIQMIHVARSLDRKDDPAGSASFKVLTSPEVFNDFLALNPSLLAAIMLHNKEWQPAPQPEQQEQQYVRPVRRDWQWADGTSMGRN